MTLLQGNDQLLEMPDEVEPDGQISQNQKSRILARQAIPLMISTRQNIPFVRTYKLILLRDFDLSKDTPLDIIAQIFDIANTKGVGRFDLNLELCFIDIQARHFFKSDDITILKTMPSFLHHSDKSIRCDRGDHPRDWVFSVLIDNHERGAEIAEE
jgi:hypothetical protein